MKGFERSGYLTLREGAAWLGMGSSPAAGRRLRRLLEMKERQVRREIIIRQGGGRCPRMYVTRAILRTHCQEHWARRDKVVGSVREMLGPIEEELQRGRIERRVLGRKVAEMERRVVIRSLLSGHTPTVGWSGTDKQVW